MYIHISSEGKWKKIIKMLNSNEEIKRKMFALYFMNYELVKTYIQKIKIKCKDNKIKRIFK